MMADEAEVTAAEEAVREAQARLDEVRQATMGGGIMLSEEVGRQLKQLRGEVEAARRRLESLRNS